jgi:O-antigen ligase
MPRETSRGFLFASLFFGPLAFGAVEPWSQAIIAGLLTLSAVTLLRFEPSPRLPAAAVFCATIALFGFLQACHLRSAGSPAGWLPFSVSPNASILEAARWGMYTAAAFAAAAIWADDRKSLLYCVYAVAGIVAVVGLAQMRVTGPLMLYGLRPVDLGRSPFGPYYNYNHAANLLAMGALSGAALIAARISAEPERTPDFWAQTVLLCCPLLLVLGALAASTSRAGLLSLLVGSISLAWLGPKSSRRWAVGMLVIFASSLFTLLRAASWLGRFEADSLQASVLFRGALYRGALNSIADFPLFGVGLGAVREMYSAYQQASVIGVVEHVHSDYLEMLMQIGIGGMLLAVTASVCLARRTNDSRKDWISAGATATVCAAAAHALVDFNLHVPANAVITFTLAGLAFPGERVNTSVLLRSGVGLIVMAAALLLIVPFSAKPLKVAEQIQARAEASPSDAHGLSREALKISLRAAADAPDDWRVWEISAAALRKLGRERDAVELTRRMSR